MARIQWQPIVAPDIGASAVAAQAQAGQALNQAFSGFTNVLDQYEGQRREANQVELLMRQNAFAGTNDVAGYSADLADGDLLRGLSFLRAGDIAGARGFTNELRTGRNAEASFARGQVLQGREDVAYNRGEEDRASGIIVAREANAVRQALSNPNLPPEERAALTARLGTLAATVQNAGQINDLYSAGRSGDQDARANENWDRDAWRYGNERQNREWTVQDRNDDKAAQALITQFREYGPNITAEDVIGSDSYKNASIGVRASVLAAFQGAGSGGGSFAGDPAAGPVGSSDPNASWAERVGLVGSESGGSLTALNSEGYGGRLQFGADRLADAARAGIVPAGMTGAAFSRQPADVQRRVEDWHFADIDRQAASKGLTRFYGQTIAGVPINQNSIRAMSHLGGIGGVERFIQSNGRQDPADSNGTRLSTYGRRFGAVRTSAEVQRNGTDLAVGAAVTSATDRNAVQARTIFNGLTDTRDFETVIQQAIAPPGEGQAASPFSGMNRDEVGRITREVQDRYERQHPGGRLPAAAAVAIAASSMTQFDVRKDGWRNLTGRSRGVGSTGGLFSTARNTLNWDQVDSSIRQLADGGRGLAQDVRNNENTQAIVQQGTAGRAALEGARAALAAQEARDLQTGQTNNPATARLRRQFLDLSQRWGEQSASSEAFLQDYGVPPARQPVSSGPQRSFVNPTPRGPQQSRYIPQ